MGLSDAVCMDTQTSSEASCQMCPKSKGLAVGHKEEEKSVMTPEEMPLHRSGKYEPILIYKVTLQFLNLFRFY